MQASIAGHEDPSNPPVEAFTGAMWPLSAGRGLANRSKHPMSMACVMRGAGPALQKGLAPIIYLFLKPLHCSFSPSGEGGVGQDWTHRITTIEAGVA